MRRLVLLALVWGCKGKDGDTSGHDGPSGDDDDAVTGDDDDDAVGTTPPGELAYGHVCTPGGWCWETPDPAGGANGGIWAVDDDDVWAASQTHLYRLGPDGIAHAAAPTLVPYLNWMPVFGVAPDDVWSHGFTSFIHWDGHVWTDLETNTYSSSIHGLAADDVWSSGFSSIQHWDGSSWTTRYTDDTFGASFVDVWATAPDQAVVGGYDGSSGKVWRIDGSTLTDLAFPGTYGRLVVAVYAPSAGEVWAVGGDGVQRLKDGTWTVMADDASSIDVWGSGPDDVWTLSQFGNTIRHWDGSTMSQETMPDGVLPYRLTGYGSAGDLWVADGDGAIHERSGGSWSSVKQPLSTATVTDLVMDDAGTAWAVTNDAVLERDASGAWSAEPGPASYGLTGLAAAGGDVLLFGSSGAWRKSASGWDLMVGGNGLVDACALSDGTVLGVGTTLATLQGTQWVADPTVPRLPLGRVICHGDEAFATSVRDYEVLQDSSELLRYRDGAWRHVGLRTIVGDTVASSFAPEPDAAWVVSEGDAPLAMGFDGSSWEEVPLPFAPAGVGGTSATDVWFVGTGGAAHLTASGLSEITDAPFADFRWVASDGAGGATIVTTPGAVWTYTPGAAQPWREVVPAGTRDLVDVAFSNGEVFAVGDFYEAMGVRSGAWVELPGSFSAESVEGSDDAGVWFTDIVDRLGHWDGSSVVEVGPDVPGTLVVPTTGRDVLAYDYSGRISVLGGSAFAQESDLPTSSLTALFGASLDDLWAIGEDDETRNTRVDHRDAGTWAEHLELVQPVAVGASASGDELWIDATQAIWRREGEGFVQLFPPGSIGESYPTTGAMIRDLDDIWVTTIGGVLHWSGTWDTLADPLGLGFYGMVTTPDGAGWALGAYGWIARHDP